MNMTTHLYTVLRSKKCVTLYLLSPVHLHGMEIKSWDIFTSTLFVFLFYGL